MWSYLLLVHSLAVLPAVRRLPKPFRAKLAGKGAFSRMDPDVRLQRTRLVERLGAKRAFPRLLVGVNVDVPLQRALFRKLPVANLALPRPIGVV